MTKQNKLRKITRTLWKGPSSVYGWLHEVCAAPAQPLTCLLAWDLWFQPSCQSGHTQVPVTVTAHRPPVVNLPSSSWYCINIFQQSLMFSPCWWWFPVCLLNRSWPLVMFSWEAVKHGVQHRVTTKQRESTQTGWCLQGLWEDLYQTLLCWLISPHQHILPRLFRPGCCGGLHAPTRGAPAQWCNLSLNVPFLRDVNTAVMELLVMAYALKTSCAKNIIGVIPYFPYSKQCKMRKRGSIVCKLLASMLAKAGMSQCNSFCYYWLVIICHLYSYNWLHYSCTGPPLARVTCCNPLAAADKDQQQTMASLVGSWREWQWTKGLHLKFLVCNSVIEPIHSSAYYSFRRST